MKEEHSVLTKHKQKWKKLWEDIEAVEMKAVQNESDPSFEEMCKIDESMAVMMAKQEDAHEDRMQKVLEEALKKRQIKLEQAT